MHTSLYTSTFVDVLVSSILYIMGSSASDTKAKDRQEPAVAEWPEETLARCRPFEPGWNAMARDEVYHVQQRHGPEGRELSRLAKLGRPGHPDELPAWPLQVIMVYCPVSATTTHEYYAAQFATMASLFSWLRLEGSLITAEAGFNTTIVPYYTCPKPPCPDPKDCKPFYSCFFGAIRDADPNLGFFPQLGVEELFLVCLEDSTEDVWVQCPLRLQNTLVSRYTYEQHYSCVSSAYERSANNWLVALTDRNIQTFLQGGVGTDDIYYTGRDKNFTLAQDLGRKWTKYDNYQCSLKQPCANDLICSEIGSRVNLELGKTVYRSVPAYLTMVALQNINQQLSNQYAAINDALGAIAQDTFIIDHYLPKPNDGSGLSNALGGLGAILSLVSGFIPGIGPGIAAAGTILPAVGSFLGSQIASKVDPLGAQKQFSQIIGEIRAAVIPALETAAETLFMGDKVNGAFNLTDMMANGSWVNETAITRISDLQQTLRIEILSRSINALWKTPTTNKMWVIFNDLDDDAETTRCLNHDKGPNSTKYCADGGVYYTYNYIEDAAYEGHVGYPWGGDQLWGDFKINMTWVTEASARTYRLAKTNSSMNPFNLTDAASTQLFLTEVMQNNGSTMDLANMTGRYPGSWTLPVCDTSTWGEDWNWDYTTPNFGKVEWDYTTPVPGKMYSDSHPPCMCGELALETYDWAIAAGMSGFETYWERCSTALRKSSFTWPDGVDRIDLPRGGEYGVNPYQIHKP